jgi:hypothetical protein
MNVKVNRRLAGGKYHVNFEVSDFAPEEIAKMSSFGIPSIDIQWSVNDIPHVGSIILTQITKSYDAVFDSEQAAKTYETRVLTQVKNAMQRLRDSMDNFSSTDEVSF